jgi:hypothetical protein
MTGSGNEALVRPPCAVAQIALDCSPKPQDVDVAWAAPTADIACRRLAELSRLATKRHRPVWAGKCPASQSRLLSCGPRHARQCYDDVIDAARRSYSRSCAAGDTLVNGVLLTHLHPARRAGTLAVGAGVPGPHQAAPAGAVRWPRSSALQHGQLLAGVLHPGRHAERAAGVNVEGDQDQPLERLGRRNLRHFEQAEPHVAGGE